MGKVLLNLAEVDNPLPIITEVPFAEKALKEQLETYGCKVIPIFVVEKTDVIRWRYEQRERKPIRQSDITRAMGLAGRAIRWECFFGTSSEVLEYLTHNEVS